MKIYIGFITDATNVVDVEVPDDFDVTDDAQREAAIGQAWEGSYVSLCHQCAHRIDLGDLLPYLISRDSDGEEIWADETLR